MENSFNQEECLMALESIFNDKKITEIEDELYSSLTTEINKKIDLNEYDENTLHDVLSYLNKHNKLLKDAVYPHLCMNIGVF
ncbi:MAG: hypothetical protein JW866_11450 [Ignavibacteriales bacterium]|nr:hypothetical protein [Ignavibacteriales bacterium]